MKKHILLVDDDKDELKIMLTALKFIDIPIKCTYASSAEHAMEMLKYLRPDVIIIDYNMPVANGLDCLVTIKADEKLREIPAYIFSTNISEKVRMAALEVGAVGCIEKPSNPRDLTEILRSFLHPLIPSDQ